MSRKILKPIKLKIFIIILADITPANIDNTDFLKSKSSIDAARVPVQAPVAGRGIATNKRRAIYILLFSELSNFCPAL